MGEKVVGKIKKYLFLISILFFVIAGSHLLYLYMYDGAEETPVEGGTISEAIIGSFPHLNPLIPSTSYNKYINAILYRSILRYDNKQGKIESDLASCDISNLALIECYLENNIKWSNGEPITEDDIIATLNLIEKTNINPGISALLENTTIEKGNGKITFNNTKKDINFLNILFQPILPKSVVDGLGQNSLDGNFSPVGGIYSGKYILTSVNQDDTVGITKMTLTRNTEYFGNDAFLDTILFKVFRDNAHFLKHKNSVNIFNDKENIIGSSIPRMESYGYTLPQFVGVFLNHDTIVSDTVKKYILHNINRESVVTAIGAEIASESYNPFLGENPIDTNYDGGIDGFLSENGYLSKVDLLKKSIDVEIQEEKKISEEAELEATNKKIQEKLNHISSPSNDKYNFISEDNVLLKGSVPAGIEKVFIGEYQLQGFQAGDDVFYYRLLEVYDSVKEGENTYKVYFEQGGKKELVDEFVYIYYTDEDKLSKIQEGFFGQVSVDTPSPGIVEGDLEIDNSSLLNLDERFYYTLDGEAFKIKLVYVNSDGSIEKAATTIKAQLEAKGVFVELIPLSLVDITRGLRDDSLVYDAILIGINLGYFDSNVFPYFHSSQVKNGYNFSNYKELGLDILLEELKSNNLTETKKDELKSKILDILEESHTLKTLYSPKINLLVDQNLEGFSLPESIPDEIHRFDPLADTYLTKKKIISTESKSFKQYWEFVFSSLFGNNAE